MSVYRPSSIKRSRRTRAELEELDWSLVEIVAQIELATVRQIFYQAVVLGLVPKDEAKGYKLVQRRLVLTFTPEGVEARGLYRHRGGPNPGTKARARKVQDLTLAGLREALEALEGGAVDVIGSSGYEVREDTIGAAKATRATEGGGA